MRRRQRVEMERIQPFGEAERTAKSLHSTEVDISVNRRRRVSTILDNNYNLSINDIQASAPNASGLQQTIPLSWSSMSLSSEYPTTIALLLLLAAIYVYHCKARRKRRHLVVTYHSVIQRKQYYRAIGALLSHPPTLNRTALIVRSNSTSAASASFIYSPTHQSSPSSGVATVDGNGNNNNSSINSFSPSSLLNRLQDGVMRLLTRVYNAYQRSSFINGRRFSGLPLLLYNLHLLWTFRFLEVAYTNNEYLAHHNANMKKNRFSLMMDDDLQQTVEHINKMDQETITNKVVKGLGTGDGWHYARLIFGLTVVGVILDLTLSYYLLTLLRQANHAVSSPIQDSDDDIGGNEYVASPIIIGGSPTRHRSNAANASNPLVPREQVVTRRPMGSISMTTSCLLWVFRDVFPNTTIPLIPNIMFFWAGNHDDLDGYDGPITTSPSSLLSLVPPTISYILCLLLLARLSWSTHPLSCILCGSGAGFLYTHGLLSFLIDEPYWTFGVLLAVTIICMVSCKVHNAGGVATRLLPCVESVACNRKGRILMFDVNGRRIESGANGNEGAECSDEDDATSTSSSDTTTSEEYLENDSNSSSAGYGANNSDDDDDDVESLARHFFSGRQQRRQASGRRRRHLHSHSQTHHSLFDDWDDPPNSLNREPANNSEIDNEGFTMDNFLFADALDNVNDDQIELVPRHEESDQSSLLGFLPETSQNNINSSAAIRSRRTTAGNQAAASGYNR